MSAAHVSMSANGDVTVTFSGADTDEMSNVEPMLRKSSGAKGGTGANRANRLRPIKSDAKRSDRRRKRDRRIAAERALKALDVDRDSRAA